MVTNLFWRNCLSKLLVLMYLYNVPSYIDRLLVGGISFVVHCVVVVCLVCSVSYQLSLLLFLYSLNSH